ncbi:hypothetical protein [Paracoccus sp. KR1-242]|uniref:hypothetical protein n=1 Tax=Paracoccus sp. KR1-242 TaxID=3410028 RepID=UPI003C04654C
MSEAVATLARLTAKLFGGNPDLAEMSFLAVHDVRPVEVHRLIDTMPRRMMTQQGANEVAVWLTLAGMIRPLLDRVEADGEVDFDLDDLRDLLAEEVRYARASIAGWPDPLRVLS